MVMLYIVIKLITGVIPRRILRKHAISLKKVLAMDLNFEEAAQTFGLVIAAVCALYPLSSYGAEGNFEEGDETEETLSFLLPSIGCGCLLLTASCEFFLIRKDMKREERLSRVQIYQNQGSSFTNDGVFVEFSSFWFIFAFIIVTLTTLLCVATILMAGKNITLHYLLFSLFLPIEVLIFCMAILCQPRRRYLSGNRWKLRLYITW